MDKGIAFAGNMIVDIVKFVDTYPKRHTLANIRKVTRSLGGLVCNCVLDMAKLDPSIPLKVVGFVGDDQNGDLIVQELSRHPSIDQSGVIREGESSFTDVITERDGSRTFFQFRGNNSLLAPQHFDFDKLDVDLLHIGYILLLDGLDAEDPEYGTAMCRVLAKAKEKGIATSIDVVSEQGERFQKLVPPALKYADYCVINEFEAENITGIPLQDADGKLLADNMKAACEKLIEMGVGRWTVIHAPEGAFGMERGGGYHSKPCSPIPDGFKVSSVGAGDAFATGILYGAYNGWTLEAAMDAANMIAAWSLGGNGASENILPYPQIVEKMTAFQKD